MLCVSFYCEISVSDMDDKTSSDLMGEYTTISAKLLEAGGFCGEQLSFSLMQYTCPLLAVSSLPGTVCRS